MTNIELVAKLDLFVREERRITQEILELIQEADCRRLYLELGYPNIYEWLTKAYGYSHTSAHRRIQSARLLANVPQAKEKLAEGLLNLSLLAQVQTAVKQAERDCEKPLGLRPELLQKVEGKSTREAERILAAEFPEQRPRETVRALNEEESKLTIVLSKEDLALLQALKEELSHSRPHATNSEIFSYLLQKHRKIPAPDRRRVTNPKKLAKIRAGGSCEFKDAKTGKICGSRYQVEVDHILPRALGGTDELSNLRCLCKQHNLFEAEQKLGKEFMSQFRKAPAPHGSPSSPQNEGRQNPCISPAILAKPAERH